MTLIFPKKIHHFLSAARPTSWRYRPHHNVGVSCFVVVLVHAYLTAPYIATWHFYYFDTPPPPPPPPQSSLVMPSSFSAATLGIIWPRCFSFFLAMRFRYDLFNKHAARLW